MSAPLFAKPGATGTGAGSGAGSASQQLLVCLADFEDSLPTPTNSLPADFLRTLPAPSSSSAPLLRDLEAPVAPLPPVKVRVSAIEEFALKSHARHLVNEDDAPKSKKQKAPPKHKDRLRGNQRFAPY